MTIDMHQYRTSTAGGAGAISSKSIGTGRMPLQSRNLNTMGSSNGPSMGGKKDSLRMPTTTLESSSSNTENKTSSQGHIVRRSSEPDGKVASTLAPKASMTRSNSVPLSSPRDGEDVIIEEKRKRASGDGYTLHRYLRGRLLGKGGFAKVYLCTALDTNKTYAVKIVPKANLVKARARQKVCTYIRRMNSQMNLSVSNTGVIFVFLHPPSFYGFK